MQWLRDVGAALSPFNAFLFLQGLETLPLRIERHSQNALAIARWLEDRPEIDWVSYPGLKSHPAHETAARYLKGGYGGVADVRRQGRRGGRPAADRQRQDLQPAGERRRREEPDHPSGQHHPPAAQRRASRLRPASTEDLVRLSVGLEHVDDLIADLDQALRAATDPSAPRELVTA